MTNVPSVQITTAVDARAKPAEPPEPPPIYVWPAHEIREAPSLHPYRPTRWRDGVIEGNRDGN